MDTPTQGILGAVVAQAVCGRKLPKSAWLIGMLAGMAADLDLFIRPAADLLGGLTYHRHFTHALAFIPVGALVAALPFVFWPTFHGSRWWVLLASLLAYATHGLLDACTSWGTVLWWPFTEVRVGWDLIGIIDPVFTLVLLIGLLWSALARQTRVATAAFALGMLYIGLGFVQHQRAAGIQHQLARMRGQQIVRGRVMPSPLNLILWRSIYEANGRLYADSIRAPFVGAPSVWRGTSAPRITLADLEHAGPLDNATRAAFQRFSWFADGYTALHRSDPRIVGDLRYFSRPDTLASMWGLRLATPGDTAPARFIRIPSARREGFSRLWTQILGHDPLFSPLISSPPPPPP